MIGKPHCYLTVTGFVFILKYKSPPFCLPDAPTQLLSD